MILFIILLSAVSAAVIFIVLRISAEVSARLKELAGSINVFGGIREQLGRLEQANKQIYDVGKDISGLQELLRAPKFRGQFGETLLENLLSQVLPKSHYQMQYRFKSGDAVDAVVRLGERLVCIDAKFSLENFQKLVDAPDEQSKSVHRRKFLQDVKNRVDEIAAKYILPQENTYDFALMYIPAENVYYEVIIKEDIFSYCSAKKVMAISPTTFYAYLQVICLGLKGLKIEENAKNILKNLSMLSIEINKVKEEFNVLGQHISNAGAKYEDAQKRLDKFLSRLGNIQEKQE